MFERFTNRARRAVVLAQEEARLLNHDYIGTEHILLGLVADGESTAARALDEIGIRLDAVRQQVEQIIGRGKNEMRSGHIPFTPRAKKILELSLREALQLGSNSIGTEHILLGLIREGHGVGAQILTRLGGDLSAVRMHVVRMARASPTEEADIVAAEAAVSARHGLRAVLEDISQRLANIEEHLGIARSEPIGQTTRFGMGAPGEGGAAAGHRPAAQGGEGDAAAGDEAGAAGGEAAAGNEAGAAGGEAAAGNEARVAGGEAAGGSETGSAARADEAGPDAGKTVGESDDKAEGQAG